MRSTRIWDCGCDLPQPPPCQVHSCGHQQRCCFCNDLVTYSDACNGSFGFRLNPNWHSPFSLYRADVQKIATCFFSWGSQNYKTLPHHLTLITFVPLPSNITRDFKLSFVFHIPYEKSVPGFSVVTTLFIHHNE